MRAQFSCFLAGLALLSLGLVAHSAPPEAPATADERLNARAPVVILDRALEEALPGLAGPRRVTLTPAPDLGSQRVTVMARERSLREVMDGLAELLNAGWGAYRTGDGPARYRLALDAEARRYEERLSSSLLERSAVTLQQAVDLTRRSAAEWAETRRQRGMRHPDDPMLHFNLYYLAEPTCHAGLALFGTLSPEQRRTLLDQEELFLPYRTMTPPQRELARARVSVRRKIDDHDRALTEEESQAEVTAWVRWLEGTGLFLNIKRDPGTGALTGYAVPMGPEMGTCAALREEDFEANLLPLRGRPYLGRRGDGEAELEKQPFPREFRLDLEKRLTWSETVAELARYLRFDLYTDDFAGTRDGERYRSRPLADLARLNLAEGLDALCKANGKLWWRRGDALYFRSRAWFLEKQYEVPPTVLARLGEEFDPKHGLTPAMLNTLANLTRRQLQGLSGAAIFLHERNGARAGGRDRAYHLLRRGYPLLVFAGELSEAQRRLVLGKGLRPAQMSPAQRETFLVLAAFHDGREILDKPELLRFRVLHGAPGALPRPGRPWTAGGMLQCSEKGMGSTFELYFTPPEPKRRPRNRTPEGGTS